MIAVNRDGNSETAIRDCLVARYPRDSFTVTNKLTNTCFQAGADIRPFYENQLKWCGVDYEDPAVQSRKCLEVCRKFGKPVIIMEPVKGGNLVSPPGETKKYPEALHGGSAACYAVRFAAGCPRRDFPGMQVIPPLRRISTLRSLVPPPPGSSQSQKKRGENSE